MRLDYSTWLSTKKIKTKERLNDWEGNTKLTNQSTKQTNKQTNKQTDRHTNKQTINQTNKQTNKHTKKERTFVRWR